MLKSTGRLRTTFLWIWIGLVFFVIFMSLRSLHLDIGVQNGDKVLHLLTYAFLAMTAPWGFHGKGLILLVVFLVLLGGSLEIGQGLLSTGRQADSADALANSLGVCFGVILRSLSLQLLGKRRAYGD